MLVPLIRTLKEYINVDNVKQLLNYHKKHFIQSKIQRPLIK